MSKHNGRVQIKTRRQPPLIKATKAGVTIGCPFCNPTHTILPGVESLCGTTLELRAVQNIIPARIARQNKLVCFKCHKTEGGDMVAYGGAFMHLMDCTPGMKIITDPPKKSIVAAAVMRLPRRVRQMVEKRTGKAEAIQEIDSAGNKTGKILGHVFLKEA